MKFLDGIYYYGGSSICRYNDSIACSLVKPEHIDIIRIMLSGKDDYSYAMTVIQYPDGADWSGIKLWSLSYGYGVLPEGINASYLYGGIPQYRIVFRKTETHLIPEGRRVLLRDGNKFIVHPTGEVFPCGDLCPETLSQHGINAPITRIKSSAVAPADCA